MRMTVYGLSFELTDAIVQHVEGRIKLSLGTASDRIDAVFVRLSDINGNRGGVDKCCRITVRLRHLRSNVVVEAVDRDLYVAVNQAAARAKHALWRQLKRRRTLRREYANRSLQSLAA